MIEWKRLAIALLAVGALGLASAGVMAAAPVTVKSATPSSTYQGMTLDVIVGGSNFNTSARVKYLVTGSGTDTGGITVLKVTYRSSSQLVTTIAVDKAADLSNFDIEVTLSDGRKGKGTTLFKVEALPKYPDARDGHSFTSNGGTTQATSRLYMFGGRHNGMAIGDLWYYSNAGSTAAAWTFVPNGTSAPGTSYPTPRAWAGWSCGAGLCVLSNGVSTSYKADTWILDEATRTWSQVACGRKVLCPSARSGPAMAFDPAHRVHVLFGGETGVALLADTYTFDASTRTWRPVNGGVTPPARYGAAATYVPNVGVVIFGGADNSANVFNDMYVWNGSAWASVTSTVNGSATTAAPALWNHSMAWDQTGGPAGTGAMIVAHGLINGAWTPNDQTWYVTFSDSGGAWKANWTLASPGCQTAAGSSPDTTIYPGARMAFDPVARAQVFFAGGDGSGVHGNTVECW